MSKKRMVPPVEISVTSEVKPEPVRKQGTTPAIVCECGSEQVTVSNTETRSDRSYPAFIASRVAYLNQKRKCVCGKCGRVWQERATITRELKGVKVVKEGN